VIEIAAPIDRMAGRVEKITGTLRRDSGDGKPDA
jgi:hypothetical protein